MLKFKQVVELHSEELGSWKKLAEEFIRCRKKANNQSVEFENIRQSNELLSDFEKLCLPAREPEVLGLLIRLSSISRDRKKLRNIAASNFVSQKSTIIKPAKQ